MDNRKKLLLLVNFGSIYRKKRFISKRRRLLKLMLFIKWHLIQSNFMVQISFQQRNTLLLATVLHKKRCYGRTEYNHSHKNREYSLEGSMEGSLDASNVYKHKYMSSSE